MDGWLSEQLGTRGNSYQIGHPGTARCTAADALNFSTKLGTIGKGAVCIYTVRILEHEAESHSAIIGQWGRAPQRDVGKLKKSTYMVLK